jgi:hypothetical protein
MAIFQSRRKGQRGVLESGAGLKSDFGGLRAKFASDFACAALAGDSRVYF